MRLTPRFFALWLLPHSAIGQGDTPPPGSVTLTAIPGRIGGNVRIISGDSGSASGAFGQNGRVDFCSEDHYSIALSTDNRQIQWIFDTDQMSASLDPANPRSRDSKACIVQAVLDVPAGYTFKVQNCRFGGYCYLDPLVKGKISTSYGFRDRLDESVLSKTLYGPMAEDFSLNIFEDTPKWAPCAKPGVPTIFNVGLGVSLQSEDPTFQARGLIQGGAVDANLTQILSLDWEKCQQSPQD